MKLRRMYSVLSMLLLFVFGFISFNTPVVGASVQQIEKYVESQQLKARIPGLAVIVMQDGKTIFKQSRGYAQIRSKEPVSDTTLFEIGSNTKAFTGVAVMKLVSEGKLELTDTVTSYLPWFQATYEDREATITIGQLLHHTSGIPFRTIADIPASTAKDALEQNVRQLSGIQLEHEPGKQFEYATINYDILGLILEQISGMQYEQFISQHILQPWGLKSTQVGRQSLSPSIATGYKPAFGTVQEYQAPEFRGNTPAGYILTDLNDMERWLKIQTGVQQVADTDLLKLSHEPDRTVAPNYDGSSYAAGWAVFQDGEGFLAHSGSNPNYSSYIAFRPEEATGVAILANMNSDLVMETGVGIMQLLAGHQPQEGAIDSYARLDRISTALIGAAGIGIVIVLWCIGRLLFEVSRRKRSFIRLGVRESGFIGLATVILVAYEIGLYRLPELLLNDLKWKFVLVWAPSTVSIAAGMLGFAGVLYYLYFVLSRLLKKAEDRSYIQLIVFSVISGLSNSALILLITQSFQMREQDMSNLLSYFVLFVAIYLLGQKYIRTKLVSLTNSVLLNKREELISLLMGASYQQVEGIRKGSIYTALNHDMETISGAVNAVVTAVTNTITLMFCFIYLGFIQFQALLFSLAVITIALLLYMWTGQRSSRYWEAIRDAQTGFYKLIEDMTAGFRELYMHQVKRTAFCKEIINRCREMKELRSRGEIKFVNAYVLGELMFIVVLGSTVFLLPLLVDSFQPSTMLHFVIVFLYIMGPVNGLLNTIPQLVRVKISWRRIEELGQEIRGFTNVGEILRKGKAPLQERSGIIMDQASFQYPGDGDFSVGPIQAEFQAGEITFIIGGNGSGKSTLAHLLTGLYKPTTGRILVNGMSVPTEQLGEYFSAVLSNYYLFDRLYGQQIDGREKEIEGYLEMLELKDKVQIVDGGFSTTKLSSGQRKRLALLLCYIEDRPVCLFDEWAADQDPHYRDNFYCQILPELRRKGKCIIAITHDERYFHVADQVLKMEGGVIVEQGRPGLQQSIAFNSGTVLPS